MRNIYYKVLYITIMGMEGCWLYAILALLNDRLVGGRLAVLGVLALYPIASGYNYLLSRRSRRRVYLVALNWLGWLVAMLLMVKIQLYGGAAWNDTAWLLAAPQAISTLLSDFPPVLLILVSSAVLWWLGARLARLDGNFTTLVGEFQFGLAMLLAVFFFGTQLAVDLPHPVYLALAFFLLALLGISIARALEGTGWLSGLNQGQWSSILLVSISLILILGLLVSVVITPDLLRLLLAAVGWVWMLIVKVIVFLLSMLPEPGPSEPIPGLTVPPIESSDNFTFWTIPEPVRNGLRAGWTVLMLGILLFALWRISSDIFGWLRRRLTGMAGAEIEPLPGAFKADFFGFLKRLLARLLGLVRFAFRRRVPARPLAPEAASVRQIYRQLLHWAASGGLPRSPFQTPHEFLRELAGRWPGVREELELITMQYARTRYGTTLPTDETLHRVKQSWHRVKSGGDLKTTTKGAI